MEKMKYKNIKLTREEQLTCMIDSALEILKEKKEYKLGKQLIEWVEERRMIKLGYNLKV